MLTALIRAFAELFSPTLRRVVGISLAIAVVAFTVLWLVVALVLDHTARVGWAVLDWAIGLLGVVGVMFVSWLLFPAVVTMIMGFFIERVAAAVEARDYPGRGPARHPAIRETVIVSLRLMLMTVAFNLLALPVYVLVPGINLFVFLGLNGYLLGREYFEVVALRRLDSDAVRTMRHRFGGRIFLGGVMIAGLFAMPILNLAAPVIATAFMVHVFEGLPRLAPSSLAS
ncbi:MAG TPA: EI24 domain-containing protein [Stellaceae bacterium]|nr:EI24 domain-containing protein [Stellaceae bacterium]